MCTALFSQNNGEVYVGTVISRCLEKKPERLPRRPDSSERRKSSQTYMLFDIFDSFSRQVRVYESHCLTKEESKFYFYEKRSVLP